MVRSKAKLHRERQMGRLSLNELKSSLTQVQSHLKKQDEDTQEILKLLKGDSNDPAKNPGFLLRLDRVERWKENVEKLHWIAIGAFITLLVGAIAAAIALAPAASRLKGDCDEVEVRNLCWSDPGVDARSVSVGYASEPAATVAESGPASTDTGAAPKCGSALS